MTDELTSPGFPNISPGTLTHNHMVVVDFFDDKDAYKQYKKECKLCLLPLKLIDIDTLKKDLKSCRFCKNISNSCVHAIK